MPGEVTALLSALCYALSYVFLHKAQRQSETVDDGLLPILVVSGAILGIGALAHALFFQRQPSADGYPEFWLGITCCAGAALLATFLGRLTLYAAMNILGATRGVVIKSLAPVVTVLVAVVVLKEAPAEDDWFGFALLACSVILLILERMWNQERSVFRNVTTYGIFLGFSAAAFQGTGHVFRKVATTYIPSSTLTSLMDVGFALLFYVIYLSIRGKFLPFARHYIKNWSWSITMAGTLSAAAVLLFFTAANTAPVSTVSVLLGLQPVLVAVVSKVFFKGLENLSWLTFAYAFLMVAGLALVVYGT